MVAELWKARTCEGLTDRDWHARASSRVPAALTSVEPDSRRRVSLGQRGGRWDVPVSDAARWFEPVVAAMGELLLLQPGWDSYGAPAIAPEVLRSAMEMLCAVMRDDTPAPAVVPTSGGGVQLEWHMRGVDLEVELATPSRIRGSFEDHRTGESWEADLSFDLRPLTRAAVRLSQDR